MGSPHNGFGSASSATFVGQYWQREATVEYVKAVDSQPARRQGERTSSENEQSRIENDCNVDPVRCQTGSVERKRRSSA